MAAFSARKGAACTEAAVLGGERLRMRTYRSVPTARATIARAPRLPPSTAAVENEEPLAWLEDAEEVSGARSEERVAFAVSVAAGDGEREAWDAPAPCAAAAGLEAVDGAGLLKRVVGVWEFERVKAKEAAEIDGLDDGGADGVIVILLEVRLLGRTLDGDIDDKNALGVASALKD